MSFSVTRTALRRQQLLLRRPQFAQRRCESTTAEAASKAKEMSGQAKAKAQEGLSRVTSSAGNVISKVGGALGGVLGGIGGRTGRLIGFAHSLVPPTVYYSRVGLELGKMIFTGRGMTPPSTAQFQKYFQSALSQVRNPSGITKNLSLQNIREMSSAQMAAGAVVAAEVIGFFTIGEIIGRFKVTGYHSKHHGQEEH